MSFEKNSFLANRIKKDLQVFINCYFFSNVGEKRTQWSRCRDTKNAYIEGWKKGWVRRLNQTAELEGLEKKAVLKKGFLKGKASSTERPY